MRNLWTLGGLSPIELLRRTARESWEDSVFGQGGRMAFYQFLAIFPALLAFLAIGSSIPHFSGPLRTAVRGLSSQVLPDQVAQLLQTVMDELSRHSLSGWQLIGVCAGALWAALNGTWAMLYGLNRAYEVKEDRSWRVLAVRILGLTLSLGAAGGIAVFLIFFSEHVRSGARALGVLEWAVIIATLSLSFAALYRFAPNIHRPEWPRITPGTACAMVLWIGATLAARLYFDHVNDYSRSYGPLNGVVMLLLWLYVTNGAILIGGEMNSEIEKAARQRGVFPARESRTEYMH